MKSSTPYFLLAFSLLLVGCNYSKSSPDPEVVSERYIHKYGYDVSPKEWKEATYPGQVVTTLRNGVVVTASYENNQLHGEMTKTHPHSQRISLRSLYERGILVKNTHYTTLGTPEKEETFLSPSHRHTIRWYKSGTPMHSEEYLHNELLEAEYYNEHNETIYKVIKGEGVRITRNEHEAMATFETISHGYPTLRKTFHPNGIPHVITSLLGEQIQGEKKVYALTGELVSVELYNQDILHGTATYYQNGYRCLEIDYSEGLKHGTERHFVDGKKVVEETEWYEGRKHGPSTVYFDGMSKTRWYYNDQLVSKEKYRQLSEQEENIAIMQERSFHPSLIDEEPVVR
ncbi:MAG: hypothetical protein AAF443_07380 [Chlamydiota bacterium]